MLVLDPVLSFTVTAGVAVLFLAAAIHKLRDPARFVSALLGYQLVPRVLSPAIGVLVVLAELSVVIGASHAATRSPAMLLAFAILVVYAIAIGINLARGRARIDCGCVGFSGRDQLGTWMVRRNLAVALAAASAAFPAAPRTMGAMDLFVIVCAVGAAAGLYMTQGVLAGARRRWAGDR